MELTITALCVGILGIGLVCAALVAVAMSWRVDIKELRGRLASMEASCNDAWNTVSEYKYQLARKTDKYEEVTGLVLSLQRKHQRATMLITKLTKRLTKADARIVSLKALQYSTAYGASTETVAKLTAQSGEAGFIGSGMAVKKFCPIPQVPGLETSRVSAAEPTTSERERREQEFGALKRLEPNPGCHICANGPDDCGDMDCDGWNNCVPSMAAAIAPTDLTVPAPEGPTPVATVSEVDPSSFRATSNVIMTN